VQRRALLLALPQLVAPAPDQWDELRKVWNPFAEKMNRGVLDLKAWKRVVAAVEKIERKKLCG
jgi:hypothetical protein